MQRVARHDPDNEHSVPYMWGTDGIGYNVDRIRQIMPDAPVDSWALVLDPQYAARFKDCGISILDAASDIRSIVLIYLGKDPNSQDPEDLKLVEEQLMKIRPYVRKINSSQYIEDLANGDLCIAVGYSGDVLQARDRAREAGKGVNIAYSLPKEGTIIWFDMMVIPADARHPRNAHLFIDYLMQPKVAAANSNAVRYPNGNLASEEFISPEVKNDPSVFPSAEVARRVSREAFERGVMAETCGSRGEVLKLLPPLVISPQDLLRGLERIGDAIRAVLGTIDPDTAAELAVRPRTRQSA